MSACGLYLVLHILQAIFYHSIGPIDAFALCVIGFLSAIIFFFVVFFANINRMMKFYQKSNTVDLLLKRDNNHFIVIDITNDHILEFNKSDLCRVSFRKKSIIINIKNIGLIQFPNLPEIKSLFSEKE